mmetsp:Transcript_14172/g.18567  ORF Transcript_14172/g.18567 Transcript_14172/m.18567 type:complete len:245 (-) Transcript_14172:228-962(-)
MQLFTASLQLEKVDGHDQQPIRQGANMRDDWVNYCNLLGSMQLGFVYGGVDLHSLCVPTLGSDYGFRNLVSGFGLPTHGKNPILFLTAHINLDHYIGVQVCLVEKPVHDGPAPNQWSLCIDVWDPMSKIQKDHVYDASTPAAKWMDILNKFVFGSQLLPQEGDYASVENLNNGTCFVNSNVTWGASDWEVDINNYPPKKDLKSRTADGFAKVDLLHFAAVIKHYYLGAEPNIEFGCITERMPLM